MKLDIQTKTGSHPLEMNNSNSILDLRKKLLSTKIVPSPHFTILLDGTELQDNMHLKDFPSIETKPLVIEMRNEFEEEDEEEEIFDDPPNFEKLIAEIVEMGFERDKAIQSLRLSDYRTDYAANILLGGNLQVDNDDDEYESDEDGNIMSRKNLGQARDIYDTFTISEKSLVHKLSKQYGIELSEAVQMFSISNKNETETISLLEQAYGKK